MTTRRFATSAILTAAVVLLALPVAAAPAATLPCLLAETSRHQTTAIDLTGDGVRETVDVFNWDQAGPTPETGLMVCRRRGGGLVRVGVQTIWGPGPGSADSGLRRAWTGDLDRSDGRVEVAARNLVTASAGEELVIVRQRARHGLRFRRLQLIAGDTVVVSRPRTGPAVVVATVKAVHAVDGRAHTERWRYSRSLERWACASDCDGRPDYTSRACAGEVSGPLGTAAVDIRVRGMTCGAAKPVIRSWLTRPRSPVAGFRITSPARFRVLGTKGSARFWFALRGTD